MKNYLSNLYHFLWAFFSALFFSFPSIKMKVIGVTGTSGKSTVVDLTSNILEEAGYKIAAISSIKIKIRDKEEENLFKMTMPGRGYLQSFFKKAQDKRCRYVILEVTSEGILQHRHRFINFDTAVFTTLYPEHIERHGNFENYKAAKGKLFRATKKVHILNLNDKNVNYFLQFPAKRKIGFTISSQQMVSSFSQGKCLVIKAENIQVLPLGTKFSVDNLEFNLKLLGEFNIYNALAAICIGISQGVPLEICKRALEKISGIPGRMEIAIRKPFKVIVDYAHTPDALEKVYSTINSQISNIKSQKLVCVLGSCGGGRDKWKRPTLGKIASQFCDEIIITNEDPYDEPPMEIIEEVARGAFEEISVNPRRYPRKSASIYKILDRRKGIREALKLAKPQDIVIITGKGCEPWMCVENGKKIPWDDRQVVREEVEKLKIPLAP